MGIIFCLSAGILCLVAGSISILRGLQCLLFVGYTYGIIRANFLDTYIHFYFDSAVAGFYIACLSRFFDEKQHLQKKKLQRWVMILVGWACLMAALPIQHYLIQLVGLRGNAFLIPFILVGTWLSNRDAFQLAITLAIFNLFAFVFGFAEFYLGVQPFYPQNSVTDLIYRSTDAGTGMALRIPATFITAHAYAGAMLSTIPWIIGALSSGNVRFQATILLYCGLGVAVLGGFLSSTRSWLPIAILFAIVLAFSGRLRGSFWIGLIFVLGIVSYVVTNEERLQRFTTLADFDMVAERIYGSVNKTFLEILAEYPMGNGMGGGGTSIPFFLSDLLRNPVGLENEYSRILLEQGLPGLMLWISFAVWIGTIRLNRNDPWYLGRRMMWTFAVAGFATAVLGTGLMTSIPQTVLFFLGIGFLTSYTQLKQVPVQVQK